VFEWWRGVVAVAMFAVATIRGVADSIWLGMAIPTNSTNWYICNYLGFLAVSCCHSSGMVVPFFSSKRGLRLTER
jgi:hypothetical protein